MSEKDGGPAFPRGPGVSAEPGYWHQDGMTYRQWLDGMALCGVLSNEGICRTITEKAGKTGQLEGQITAELVVACADAMIKVRENE